MLGKGTHIITLSGWGNIGGNGGTALLQIPCCIKSEVTSVTLNSIPDQHVYKYDGTEIPLDTTSSSISVSIDYGHLYVRLIPTSLQTYQSVIRGKVTINITLN